MSSLPVGITAVASQGADIDRIEGGDRHPVGRVIRVDDPHLESLSSALGVLGAVRDELPGGRGVDESSASQHVGLDAAHREKDPRVQHRGGHLVCGGHPLDHAHLGLGDSAHVSERLVLDVGRGRHRRHVFDLELGCEPRAQAVADPRVDADRVARDDVEVLDGGGGRNEMARGDVAVGAGYAPPGVPAVGDLRELVLEVVLEALIVGVGAGDACVEARAVERRFLPFLGV
jgi:hypothetical protein